MEKYRSQLEKNVIGAMLSTGDLFSVAIWQKNKFNAVYGLSWSLKQNLWVCQGLGGKEGQATFDADAGASGVRLETVE